MSDASTKQAVECPICGDEFDPTVAGGWCTNTECGEWQYTEGSNEPDESETESSDDGFVSQDADGDSDSVDLFSDSEEDESAQADEADVDDVGADLDLGTDDSDADESDEAGFDADESDETEEVDDAEVDLDAVEAPDVDEELDADDADDAAAETDDDVEVDLDAADEVDADEEPDADEALDADDADDAAAETDDEADVAVVDCPDCGVELDAEANFCVECGADVSNVPAEDDSGLEECPGCGVSVEDEDNFCVNCGEDLDAHRESDTDESHDDAIDALESDDPDEVPESLVLEVEGREIYVGDGDTVGREIRAALTDAGRPDDEAVRIHREHVRFVRESDSFYLLDLGDNPTQLNGKTLKKGDREPVAPGDELELSGVAAVSVQLP